MNLDLVLAWSAMLWFDTTVFLLTLARAIRMRYHVPGSLLEIFFRDGKLLLYICTARDIQPYSSGAVGTLYYGSAEILKSEN